MHVDENALRELIKSHLSTQDAKNCRVYYDTEIKDAGSAVPIGLSKVPMPFRGFLVFVDLMPKANWGHRVEYLLVGDNLTDCERHEDQFPPFSGQVPANWKALSLTA